MSGNEWQSPVGSTKGDVQLRHLLCRLASALSATATLAAALAVTAAATAAASPETTAVRARQRDGHVHDEARVRRAHLGRVELQAGVLKAGVREGVRSRWSSFLFHRPSVDPQHILRESSVGLWRVLSAQDSAHLAYERPKPKAYSGGRLLYR